MLTKRDLKNYLEEISPGANFLRFEFASSERFRIDLRSRVDRDQTVDFYIDYTKEWIKKFSKYTTTTWNVRTTFTKMKRLVFRKIYICHLSGFNKKKKVKTSRNQNCHATVEFKVKLTNRNTIKNDKLLLDGLNMFIYINFTHSHKVYSPEIVQLLRATSDIEEDFKKIFVRGCMPAAAKCYHELALIDKYGDNRPDIFNNALINPTLNTVTYFYAKHGKKIAVNIPSFRELIEEKKSDLKEAGIDMAMADPDELAVIITPLMKRIMVVFGLEYILVESISIPQSIRTTIFFVPTKIGALPIAYVLHGENSDDFQQTLQLTKNNIEMVTGLTFSPKTIVMNKFEGQNVWQEIFPKTRFLKSGLRLCEEFWRWLNNPENKVERKKRQALMLSAKCLFSTQTAEEAEKVYAELQDKESVTVNPKLQEYLLENCWDKRQLWMQQEYPSKNLVEISIRILKEFLIQKCKSFTASMIVEIITNMLETHHKRIMMSFVNKNRITATMTRFLTKARVVLDFGSEVRRISANEFKLEVPMKSRNYINFRIDTMFCDCVHGKKGYMCDHLTAIVNTIDCDAMKPPVLNDEEKNDFTNIVGQDFQEEVKSECDDIKNFESKVDIDKLSEDFGESGNIDDDFDQSAESSTGSVSEVNDSFYFEVKTEKPDRYDPLEEGIEEVHVDRDFATETETVPTTSQCPNKKKRYETALRAVNDEFRRLNRYFSEHPNETNYDTMTQLARELSKIRPVEPTNLDNLFIKLNTNKKKKKKS